MNDIAKILNDSGYKTQRNEDRLDFESDTIVGFVRYLDENENRFILRASSKAGFDRWANSVAVEEFFKTKEDLEKYLLTEKEKFYNDIMAYMSEEIVDLTSQAGFDAGYMSDSDGKFVETMWTGISIIFLIIGLMYSVCMAFAIG